MKSEFKRNVLTLMLGTLVGQALPFISTFVLARIFAPEEIGEFAYFLSAGFILGTLFTGKYEQAVLLPKGIKEAITIVKLCLILSGSLSFVILFLFVLLKICEVNISIPSWNYYWMLSLLVLGISINNTLIAVHSRLKNYKLISKGILIRSLFSVSFQLIGGYLFGLIGLFVGSTIGYFSGNLIMFLRLKEMFYDWKIVDIKTMMMKYKKFPIYDLPASLLYSFSKNGIVLILGRFYGSVPTGLYSMSEKLMISPSQVIVGSYIQVFNQKLTEEYNKTYRIVKLINKNIYALAKILVVPFILGIYLSEIIIPYLLGPDWLHLYGYILILAPFVYFSMIINPMGYVLKIYDLQNVSLKQHTILALGKIFTLIIGFFFFELSPLVLLMYYSIISVIILLFNAFEILKIIESGNIYFYKLSAMAFLCISLIIFNYYAFL